jgi:hypothetical protein
VVAVLLDTPALVKVLMRLLLQEAQFETHLEKHGSRFPMLMALAALAEFSPLTPLVPPIVPAPLVASAPDAEETYDAVSVPTVSCFAAMNAAARVAAALFETPAVANVLVRLAPHAAQLVVQVEKHGSRLATLMFPTASPTPAPVRAPFDADANAPVLALTAAALVAM